MPSAIRTGTLLAVCAAIAFGVTTPVVAWAGTALGPLLTAALLYLGAATAAFGVRSLTRRHDAPVRRADLPRVLAVALVGGALAPTLLAWGLQRAGGTVGSLLLNLEAVFTIVLARMFFREPMGRRVVGAMLAMVAGGVALTLTAWTHAAWSLLGVLAVTGATLAWAADNTLTRPLAERDPFDVVALKGGIGALLTASLGLALREPLPSLAPAAALLACGATGYGLSLLLYLRAQRIIGAARTGSVFALAPFVGAAVAVVLGDRSPTAWTLAAAALFLLGVMLHATERHEHPHAHASLEHEHTHRHDDGHHTHTHDPPFVGEHSHPHRHDPIAHTHAHAADIHHGHDHA